MSTKIKYYHGSNHADEIMQHGFKLLPESENDSEYLGDNIVEGIFLSTSLEPYGEEGQLADVSNVLEVSINSGLTLLKVKSFKEVASLFKKYKIKELSEGASLQLTKALQQEGYDGVEMPGDEIIIFNPDKLTAIRIVPWEEINQDSFAVGGTMMAGKAVGTLRPDFMQSPMLMGREIEISMPNGEKRKAQFAIVEAADIIASHNEKTFASSDGYPETNGQNINDRNYKDDKNAQAKVIEVAQNLDPNILISTSRTPAGTPIITTDGIVVSGNNRTMSLKLAIAEFPENYRKYCVFLIEELESFGLKKQAVTPKYTDGTHTYEYRYTFSTIGGTTISFDHPILVRIDYDFPAYNTTELSKYNKDTKKSERPIDKAIKIGRILNENENCKRIISEIVGEFETFSEFYGSFRSQKKLVDTLVDCNIITRQELAGYFMETGFTEAGKDLIENMLAGLVLSKEALIAANIEGVRGFRNIIITSLPVLVKNGTLGNDSLIPALSEAVIMQAKIAQAKLSFEHFINQQNIFDAKFSLKAAYINRLLDEGRNKFKRSIEDYNQSIINNQGDSLFGEKPTVEQIFQQHVASKIEYPLRQAIGKNLGDSVPKMPESEINPLKSEINVPESEINVPEHIEQQQNQNLPMGKIYTASDIDNGDFSYVSMNAYTVPFFKNDEQHSSQWGSYTAQFVVFNKNQKQVLELIRDNVTLLMPKADFDKFTINIYPKNYKRDSKHLLSEGRFLPQSNPKKAFQPMYNHYRRIEDDMKAKGANQEISMPSKDNKFQYKFHQGDTVHYKDAEQTATVLEATTAPHSDVLETYSIKWDDNGKHTYAYADDLVAAEKSLPQEETKDEYIANYKKRHKEISPNQPESWYHFQAEMAYERYLGRKKISEAAKDIIKPEWDKMQEFINPPQNTTSLLINDEWFKQHPDKVLGEEYERSGRFGKEKAIKGSIENISRIDADLTDQQAQAIQPMETVIQPEPEQQMTSVAMENIKKSLKRSKVDYAERKIENNPNELYEFEEILDEYNQGISRDDIEAFVWYKKHIGDPLSGAWTRYAINSEEELVKKKDQWIKDGVICWHKGDYMPSYVYYAENIYERIKELREEEKEIVEKFGQEQYNRQMSGLETVKPMMLSLTSPITEFENRRLTVLPISKFAKDNFVGELKDGTQFTTVNSKTRAEEANPHSLMHAFEIWMGRLPKNAFQHGTNSSEIERYYTGQQNFPRDTTKEEKLRIQQRTKQEGNRLFAKFLAEELTLQDQAKIEYKWNSTFNGYVDVNYNKVPIAFQCSKYFQNEKLFIRPEKREAVAFTFANGSSCLAYDVGVGKTISALFTIAQYMDAGYAKRPLIVVPNQTYQQWIQETKGKIVDGKVVYNGVLPQVEINDFYNLGSGYADKITVDGKIQMVKAGSITFITYEGLELIGISEANQHKFTSFIYDIVNQGTEASRDKASLMEKVEKAAGKGLKNTIFNIEEFGFDFICFDEAHKMKKSFTQVKGEMNEEGTKREDSQYSIKSGTPSDIAIKGLMLSQFVFQQNNNRNIMLLTATPFTNSPLEIFSMLALIGYQRLKKEGLNNINEFFNTFVKTSTELVISAKLKPERKEIVMGFNNLITLQQIIYRFINYKTGEDVGVERPNKIVLPLFNRKDPVTGQVEHLPPEEQISTYLPMSPLQQEFMKDIEAYIRGEASLGEICNQSSMNDMPEEENEATATVGVELHEGNMTDEEKAGVRILRGLSYAKLVALSPYLYPCNNLGDPTYKDYVESSPKFKMLMGCIRSVKQYHEDHNEPMSGQLVYMNAGVDYFPLLKKYLIYELGFKESEVGIIKSGMSAAAKDRIKNKFNAGEIHVVIGSSTIKEGMNLQKRTTVGYNCYLDWNPTDIKQWEGRGWRFGNEFANIRFVNPLVENSADSFIFQKLEEKTSRINEIWTRTNRQNDLKLEEFNPMELKMGLITDPKALAELQVMQEKEKLEDDINGIETEIEILEGFKKAKDDFDSHIRQFDELVEKYRPAQKDKETGKRQSRKLTTRIALFEDVLKTQTDSEGDYLYLDYDDRSILSTIKEANRIIARVERTYLIPKGLSLNEDPEKLISDLHLRIKDIKSDIELKAGPEAIKEIAKDIARQRKEQKMRSATVEDRVAEFAKLNNLLSIKKVYGAAKTAIVSDTEKLLADVAKEFNPAMCPPMTADGKRDISETALAALQRCIDNETQTKNNFIDKNGNYTDARKKLHETIINEFKEKKPCIQEKPIAVLTGGPPGSGKSRFLKTHAKWLLSENVVHIDADEVRAKLPEYKGWNATNTHLETKDIVDQLITEIGTPCKTDLVYDGTMNKAKNYIPLIERLKALGYEVFIIYMQVPEEVSRHRVLERYQRTGRYVPKEVIDEVYEMGTGAFDMIKNRVDGFIRIDGETNKVLEKGGKEIPENRNYKLSDGTGVPPLAPPTRSMLETRLNIVSKMLSRDKKNSKLATRKKIIEKMLVNMPKMEHGGSISIDTEFIGASTPVHKAINSGTGFSVIVPKGIDRQDIGIGKNVVVVGTSGSFKKLISAFNKKGLNHQDYKIVQIGDGVYYEYPFDAKGFYEKTTFKKGGYISEITEIRPVRTDLEWDAKHPKGAKAMNEAYKKFMQEDDNLSIDEQNKKWEKISSEIYAKYNNKENAIHPIPPGMVVSTLIFDKTVFPFRSYAQKWAKKNHYKHGKTVEKDNTFRIVHRSPYWFSAKSYYNTIPIADGVQAIIGKPKKGRATK